MVPYSLPFSSAFFSKIIVSSVAVIVITTVSLNSYGSVTIGASNGTVLIIPKNNDSPPGLIDEKGSIFLEDKLDQVKKKNSSNLEVNAKKHKHDKVLRNKKEIHKREIISEKIAFDQSIDEPRNFHSDIVPTIAPTIQKHESEPVNNSDNNGEDCSTIDMFLNPTDDHLDQVEVTSQVLTTKRSSVTLSTVKPHSIEQFPSDFIPENVSLISK